MDTYPKKKDHMSKNSFPKEACYERKKKQMWKGWRTTNCKGGHGEGNQGEVADTELKWQYAMGNKTKQDN